jgi:hypothetical protein
MGWALWAALWIVERKSQETIKVSAMSASEELLAAPLPVLIRDMGLAVAEANQVMSKNPSSDVVYAIDEAEIEVKVAISVSKGTDLTVGGGANFSVFNVNASYSKTYGFKEEASSRILIKLSAKPPAAE